MVRPDCSVDAPPVVILALALVSAPPAAMAAIGAPSVNRETSEAVAIPEVTVLTKSKDLSVVVVDCCVGGCCMENPSVSSTLRQPTTAIIRAAVGSFMFVDGLR